MTIEEMAKRQAFIHLVRSGLSIAEAAAAVGRSRAWGYKWDKRFVAQQDWRALADQARCPHHHPRRLPDAVYQAIRQIRSELEAEAQSSNDLGYIGATAIRAQLQARSVVPLPSVSSIERELHRAGLTHWRPPGAAVEIQYPHLCPQQPHQLIQADILPRYLTGGTEIACFNAIDVVSRYPSGCQFERRTAANARAFLWHVWQEQGVPIYQQVDNEDCFSGGHTHPCALGQVVRLALYCAVQLVFSPFYHPQSNGVVERFHQDYASFVWQKAQLADLPAVHQRSALYYALYRRSRHHSALQGQSPAERHAAVPKRTIPSDLTLPDKLPLTAGQVHFMRAVDQAQRIKVLNCWWTVSAARPQQGVWATLNLSPEGATLSVFDAAPDASQRTCLAKFEFPLKEPVVPLHPALRASLALPAPQG